MKRRDFLKILGACVVVPGTVITVRARSKPKKPWEKYAAIFSKNDIKNKEMLEKFREAAKNTKYANGLPVFYYRNCLIYYQSSLA